MRVSPGPWLRAQPSGRAVWPRGEHRPFSEGAGGPQQLADGTRLARWQSPAVPPASMQCRGFRGLPPAFPFVGRLPGCSRLLGRGAIGAGLGAGPPGSLHSGCLASPSVARAGLLTGPWSGCSFLISVFFLWPGEPAFPLTVTQVPAWHTGTSFPDLGRYRSPLILRDLDAGTRGQSSWPAAFTCACSSGL